jgi:hypothetical protein
MTKKTHALATLALAVTLTLGIARPASSAEMIMQGSAGHIWNGSGLGTLRMVDTRICSSSSTITIWVVPFPLSVTGATYSGTMSRQGSNFSPPTGRLVSFTNGGDVFQAGSFMDNTDIGSVFVPSGGMLFSQHQVASAFNLSFFGCLASVKVNF